MILAYEKTVKMSWAEFSETHDDDAVYKVEFGGKMYELRHPLFNVKSINGDIATVKITGNLHVTWVIFKNSRIIHFRRVVRGVNLSNMAIEATEMSDQFNIKCTTDLLLEVGIKNFFVWKDILYFDAYKRQVSADEQVVTEELLRFLNIDLSIDQIKVKCYDRLQA